MTMKTILQNLLKPLFMGVILIICSLSPKFAFSQNSDNSGEDIDHTIDAYIGDHQFELVDKIKSKIKGISTCYSEHYKGDDNVYLEMLFKFSLQGRQLKLTFEGHENEAAFKKCLKSQLIRIRLKPVKVPKGYKGPRTFDLDYPLVLNTQKS